MRNKKEHESTLQESIEDDLISKLKENLRESYLAYQKQNQMKLSMEVEEHEILTPRSDRDTESS